MWARGMLFTSATFLCTMAFGLYSERQRARTIGILFRVVASVGAAVAITAVGLYLIPHLWIARPVLGIAGIPGDLLVADTEAGISAPCRRFILQAPRTGVRCRPACGADRSACDAARISAASWSSGFVQPPGEELAVPMERLIQSGRNAPRSVQASRNRRNRRRHGRAPSYVSYSRTPRLPLGRHRRDRACHFSRARDGSSSHRCLEPQLAYLRRGLQARIFPVAKRACVRSPRGIGSFHFGLPSACWPRPLQSSWRTVGVRRCFISRSEWDSQAGSSGC